MAPSPASPPGDRDDGCPFCAMAALPLEDSLVAPRRDLLRGAQPASHNPGHLMVLRTGTWPARGPDRRRGVGADGDDAAGGPGAASVSGPHAFNVGINLGGVAGGSLSQHLHQHVVPRWSGDANFITVLGGTKTLPQPSPTPAR